MGIRNRVVAVAGAGALAFASALLPSYTGTELIKQHEQRVNVAYLDAVGIPTICFGSTRDVRLGTIATDAECDRRLKQDLALVVQDIRRSVRVPITQAQFDALTSFVFNVGGTRFRSSTLLKRINAGDCLGAGREFSRWVYAKGKRLRGLVNRRAIERNQWESGCSAW